MTAERDAYARLMFATETTRTPCADDPSFTLDHAQVPAAEVLRMRQACAQCPLFDLCARYADLAKPEAGFWAGKWRT